MEYWVYNRKFSWSYTIINKIDLKYEDGSWYTINNAEDFGCLKDGVCILYISAVDNANNINNKEALRILIDNTAPNIFNATPKSEDELVEEQTKVTETTTPETMVTEEVIEEVIEKVIEEKQPSKHIAIETKVEDKEIPNVYLIESTNAQVLAEINPIYVKNGVGDRKDKNVSFVLDNLENIDNVIMGFEAIKRKGILYIDLNGERIYEGFITKINPEPIRLRKELLQRNNILQFSVFTYLSTNIWEGF